MSNALPLSIRMGALPINFQAGPQELGDAIAARLTVIAQQSLALFVTGAAEPFSNVGPWLDTGTSVIGIWKNWDDITGRYQPMSIADETRGYIVSQVQPDPLKFKLWLQLNSAGKALSLQTWYAGAWHDAYEDKFATMQAAISGLLPNVIGSAGTVLTSAGVGSPLLWQNPAGIPAGVVVSFSGSVSPLGWLLCQGGVQPIVTYPALAAVLGTTYGGDGVSTFGIPAMSGRTVVGVGLGSAPDATLWPLASIRGNEKHTLSEPELPIVQLTNSFPRYAEGGNTGGNIASGGSSLDVGGGSIQINPFGGGLSHNNIQPSIALNFIIKT